MSYYISNSSIKNENCLQFGSKMLKLVHILDIYFSTGVSKFEIFNILSV